MDKIEFLTEMDSKIWVKDRLFFTRYIVLYALTNKLPSMLDKLNQVISMIPPTTKAIDPIPELKKDKDIIRLAYNTITKLDLTKIMKKHSSYPHSTVEQFFSNFQFYGLREALAYLGETSDSSFNFNTISIQNTLLDFYEYSSKIFTKNIKPMKKIYKRVLDPLIKKYKALELIMPEGFLCKEARSGFTKAPDAFNDLLKKIKRDIVSIIDIDEDEGITLELLMLCECLTFGGYWENGQEQENYADE